MTTSTEIKRGFYGWWIVAFLFIIYAVMMGFTIYSFSALFPPMILDLGWTRGQASMGLTIASIAGGFSSPLVAWAIGKISARMTTMLGSIAVVLSTGLIGLYGGIYPLYLACSFVLGLGMAFAATITVQTIAVSWFMRRRALALGIVLSGAAIGGFIAPLLVTSIVNNSGGNWRLGWFFLSIAAAVVTFIALLLRDRPSDIGQHPDGINPDDRDKSSMGIDKQILTYQTTQEWTSKQGLKSTKLWFWMVTITAASFAWMLIASQGVLHLGDNGFNVDQAVLFYSLSVGLSVLGRIIMSSVGDRVEPRFMGAAGVGMMLLGILLFWLASPNSIWMAYTYPALAGIGYGITLIAMPMLVANYFGVKAFPGILAIIVLIIAAVSSIAPIVAGVAYDVTNNYNVIFLVAIAWSVAGVLLALLCTPPKLKESI